MEIFEAIMEEYSCRTDHENQLKTIEEIEKMEREFSEASNRAQLWLDITFPTIEQSSTKETRPKEGYKQSENNPTIGNLQYSKEDIERRAIHAEEELSRKITALEDQVQQEWTRFKENYDFKN